MKILSERRWYEWMSSATGLSAIESRGVGVDVGSRFVKTVVLEKKRQGLTLADYSVQAVDQRPLHQASPIVPWGELIKKTVTGHQGIIGTSLSGPSVLIKSLSLPVMTQEELREHLTLELDRYIGIDVQDVVWDIFSQRDDLEAKEGNQGHVLVVAKKEWVANLMEAWRQCGANLQFVDIDAFALVNLVTYNYGSEGTWLLANIGPTGIVIVIIADGHLRSIHKVVYEAEWYGDFLDQILLPQPSHEKPKELGASETLLLEQFIKEIRQHIEETLEGFSGSPNDMINNGLLLTGGYAVVPEIVPALTDSLRLPVRLLDPFQSIIVSQAIQESPDFQQNAHLMSVAVGVAVRGALEHD